MNKMELRKKYIKIRKKITNRYNKEQSIINKITKLEKYQKSKVVGLYCAYNGEVNIDELIKHSLNVNKIVAVPVIIDEHNMVFCKIKSLDELNNYNTYGIRETSLKNIITDIDLIIVPGICFDVKKNRIGYGKGYYDNYLRNSKSYNIGICFQEQLTNNIYNDDLDIKLDSIITDNITINWLNYIAMYKN